MDLQQILTNVSIIDIAAVVGYFIGIFCIARQFSQFGRQYFNLFFILGLIHLSFTFYYYFWTLAGNGGDCILYIDNTIEIENWLGSYGFGTTFITFVLYPLLKLGFSYLGCSVIFSFVGLLGYKYLLLVAIRVNNYSWSNYFYLLLMPNLHFWTNAVGKDGLIFFAICLIIYNLSYNKRIIAYLLPVLIVGSIRFHVLAFIVAAFLSATVFFNTKLRSHQKVFLSIAIIAVMALFFPVFLRHIGVENIFDIVELQEHRMLSHMKGGGAVDVTDANIVTKWFAYMFRPLFFDVNNTMALMASFDNLVWLTAVIYALLHLYRAKTRNRGLRLGFQIWFYFLAILYITLPLAFELANLGLALRQKTMALPFLFLLIIHIHYLYRTTNVSKI